MSLEKRILSMCAPDNVVSHPLCMGGYSVAQQRAAGLAAEADELMREMMEAIRLYATAETATQARAASDELIRMHKKLHDQKEQTDDQ